MSPPDFAALSRIHGIPAGTLRQRYLRGDRGAWLVRPIGEHRRQPPPPSDVITVGLSVNEWRPILADAEEHGEAAAALRHRVPLEAVQAMRADRWERVA